MPKPMRLHVQVELSMRIEKVLTLYPESEAHQENNPKLI